jgi:hypothetical protein
MYHRLCGQFFLAIFLYAGRAFSSKWSGVRVENTHSNRQLVQSKNTQRLITSWPLVTGQRNIVPVTIYHSDEAWGGFYKFGQCRNRLYTAGSIHIGCAIFFIAGSKKKTEKANSLCCFKYNGQHFFMNVAVLLYLTFSNVPWMLCNLWAAVLLGTILVSISILFTGLIFARTKIKFTWKHTLLFIVPAISIAVLLTNQSHHLFYTTFSLIPSRQNFGIYFTNIPYTPICV